MIQWLASLIDQELFYLFESQFWEYQIHCNIYTYKNDVILNHFKYIEKSIKAAKGGPILYGILFKFGVSIVKC